MNVLKKIKSLWNNFSIREKVLSCGFAILIVLGLAKASSLFLNKITVTIPIRGGSLNYGIWEVPKTINPVISQNNDAEQELINVIYSGILKEDGKGGLKNDLAKEININKEYTIYEINLREDVYFHDGKKLTADDVVFTVGLIKNSDYNSPLFGLFKDIKIEKLGESMVKITVPNSQTNFYNYLTFKIIPRHLWEKIDFDQFAINDLNIRPIGSGPYIVTKTQKNKSGKIVSIYLKRNPKYFDKVYIEKIVFNIFDNIEEAFGAFVKGNIDIIKELTPYQKDLIKNRNKIRINNTILPRYYAVFLNQKNPLFTNTKVKQAMDLSLDKASIISSVFFNEAELLNAPISSSFIGYVKGLNTNNFNLKLAKEKLAEAKYEDRDKDGVLEKWNGKTKTDLEFSLLLPSNNELIHLADMIKKNWESVGIRVNLQIVPFNELQKDYLKTRNYDALLFGQTYTTNPDLYYFWHSGQANNPGLNLSVYKNSTVDSILEINHTTFDKKQLEKNLVDFQEILDKDIPAIFLNNPYYINAYYKKLKIEDNQIYNSYSSSFGNINEWYIFQKRSLK